jgi:hypothetical protein
VGTALHRAGRGREFLVRAFAHPTVDELNNTRKESKCP